MGIAAKVDVLSEKNVVPAFERQDIGRYQPHDPYQVPVAVVLVEVVAHLGGYQGADMQVTEPHLPTLAAGLVALGPCELVTLVGC